MDKVSERALIIIFAGLIAVAGFVMVKSGEWAEKEKKRENQFTSSQAELDEIFGKYNDNYTDKVWDGKDARVLVLEANNNYTKKANEAIVNYLTNVGGKLVSINGKEFTEKESSLKAMPIILGNLAVPMVGQDDYEVDKSKNTYVIMIPKNAQFADELQEKLDLYVEFSK